MEEGSLIKAEPSKVILVRYSDDVTEAGLRELFKANDIGTITALVMLRDDNEALIQMQETREAEKAVKLARKRKINVSAEFSSYQELTNMVRNRQEPDEVPIGALITYWRDQNSGFGRLPNDDTNESINLHIDWTTLDDPPPPHPPVDYFALTITHDHYLRCLFIDPGYGTYRSFVHLQYDKTLQQYHDELRRTGVYPLMDYSDLSDKGDKIRYTYVSKEYRSIMKGMIEFVTYLHEKEKALDEYDLSLDKNLVIQDDVLKLCDIKFQKATKVTKKNDFIVISAVMEKLFVDYHRKTRPYDLRRLLSLLRSGQSITRESLLKRHLSVLSSSQRISFFKSLYDKHNELEFDVKSTGKYRKMLAKYSGNIDWIAKLDRKPRFGPLGACHKKSIDKAAERDRPYCDSSDRGNYTVANIHFLRHCRNLATHLKDNFQHSFHDHDIDIMMMSLFDEDLTKFQEELDDASLLELYF